MYHYILYLDSSSLGSEGPLLRYKSIFEDDNSLKYRPVMDIQSSSHYPELFLVAYGSKDTSSTSTSSSNINSIPILSSALNSTHNSYSKNKDDDFDGIIAIWSTVLPTRPEFKFVSTSPILAACFHPQSPNLIIGSCYNGQILLWDMKNKSSLPVQRSFISGD